MLADNLNFAPRRPAPIDLESPRLVGDIIKELNARLAPIITDAEGAERFGCVDWPSPSHTIMPSEWHSIACFATRGNCEGFIVYIEMMLSGGRSQYLGSAKCWSWDAAFKLANAATRILYE